MSKLNFNVRNTSGSLRAGLPAVFGLFFVVALLVCGMLAAPVHADSGGYTTSAFDVNVETDADHVFHVSEEIQVEFSAPRHGIYRYIPDGGRYYGVKNVSVQDYEYDVYEESGNTVVQIGSVDYYVDGAQTYRISYDIVGYRDDDETADFLSLDLLPTGWGTDIESASLRIAFPAQIGEITTYTGLYGGDDGVTTAAGQSGRDENGYFDIASTGTVYTAVSRQSLPEGMGLTIKADLPEGYWVDPYSREDALPLIYGILAVMGMLMLLLWLFVGRDAPIIQTVEFYPPEDMDPLEIAYLGNDEVQSRDISALFLYMAGKGYVEIESDGKKTFTLHRKENIDSSERSHTRKVFHALFTRGSTVRLKNLPERFGEVAASIPGEVKRSMEQRRPSFSAASKAGRTIGLAFCLLIPLTGAFACAWLNYGNDWGMIGLFGLPLVIFVSMLTLVGKTDAFRTRKRPVRIIIGFVILLAAIAAEGLLMADSYPVLALVFVCAALAAAVATIFVRRRMNNELFGRVLGFREFIRTAEYDRLKMLSDENPEYYFNIMPYACVFGMSTKWADKFADFRIPQPSWYHSSGGSWDPYFGYYMYHHTGNAVAGAVSSHYKAVGADILSSATDSGGGGGGFGGGGFSGGGFGGGGGGSW